METDSLFSRNVIEMSGKGGMPLLPLSWLWHCWLLSSLDNWSARSGMHYQGVGKLFSHLDHHSCLGETFSRVYGRHQVPELKTASRTPWCSCPCAVMRDDRLQQILRGTSKIYQTMTVHLANNVNKPTTVGDNRYKSHKITKKYITWE